MPLPRPLRYCGTSIETALVKLRSKRPFAIVTSHHSMTRPIETFPAYELPERVRRAQPWPQFQPGFDIRARNGSNSHERATKPAGSGKLADCWLAELVQYDCSVTKREQGTPRIVCEPIERLFRR